MVEMFSGFYAGMIVETLFMSAARAHPKITLGIP